MKNAGKISLINVCDIKPYENNPRNNNEAVSAVAASIREFGFKVPIILDAQGVIVAGHTRYKEAKMIGLEKVPCITADDLTPKQVKAFRLADNKVGELAKWDFEMLENELDALEEFDMAKFGFDEFEDDVDMPKDDPKEEKLKPYDRHHVLISCGVAQSPQVMRIVNQLREIPGVEIENAYN